jgi:hypothetical protein
MSNQASSATGGPAVVGLVDLTDEPPAAGW